MSQSDMIPFLIGEAANCLRSCRYQHALTLLTKAFLLDPKHRATFLPLAMSCQLLRRWTDLEHFCHLRLQASPDDTDAHYHLAGAALSLQKYSNAINLLKKVLAIYPQHFNAWIDLGCTWKKTGDIEQAIHCFHKAVTLDPSSVIAQDNLLFSLLFSNSYSREQLFEAHRNWGALQIISTTAPFLPVVGGRIRIGYLSPDFREHSVTSFLEPLLISHDHSRFEIFCYHSHTDEDAVTERLKSYADQWRKIADINDNDAAKLIHNDGIHILVELAGHTAWNRLLLLNLRPAPIQITWLGYPHSTGMTSVDYRITDAVTDPPGVSEQLHTEELIHLSKTFLCFQPPDGIHPSHTLPYQRNGYITFGSFNNFAKVSPATIDCWRKILTLVPDAHLLLKSEIFTDQEACRMITEKFALPQNRLIMIGTTPDRNAHMALYGQVDIALDTFPYNGTTTTCEALYMGVPVITLVGDHHASRVGGSLLQTVGVGELAANSVEEYVEKAIELARDVPRLAMFRMQLPKMIASSPLMDRKGFTIEIEQVYQQMWQRVTAGD